VSTDPASGTAAGTAAGTAPEPAGGPTEVKLSRLRRAIAKSMSASALVPQFTVEYDVPFGSVAAYRGRWKAAGHDISVADVLTAACARALRSHPGINASWAETSILQHADIHVGLAVALPDGLVAPAVRSADTLDLGQLAAERKRLALAAQEGRLTPDELLSATFTISNLGTFGVSRFRALVVPPQAAILAVGGLRPDGTVSLALSCDHRVLDGAPAAMFLRDLAGSLTEPAWLEDLVPERSTS
jgi:pyruvate dehydrogenase E2 component (dihydrolipoamide acetyltransferase)